MVKPNASGMGSTARFRGILQKGKRWEKFWAVLQLGGVVWGNVTRAFVERLQEMGATIAQNFGTHGKFRPQKLQNRPELWTCVGL